MNWQTLRGNRSEITHLWWECKCVCAVLAIRGCGCVWEKHICHVNKTISAWQTDQLLTFSWFFCEIMACGMTFRSDIPNMHFQTVTNTAISKHIPQRYSIPNPSPLKLNLFQTKPYRLDTSWYCSHQSDTPTQTAIPRTGFRLVQRQKQSINVLLVHAILELWMPSSLIFLSSFMSFSHFLLFDWRVWVIHGFGASCTFISHKKIAWKCSMISSRDISLKAYVGGSWFSSPTSLVAIQPTLRSYIFSPSPIYSIL